MDGSTKVQVRDAVSARRGGALLSVAGAKAHVLCLNMEGQGLKDRDMEDVAKSFVGEVRRKFHEVSKLRHQSWSLEVSIRLNDNEMNDGLVAFLHALDQVKDLVKKVPKFVAHNNPTTSRAAKALAEFLRRGIVEECTFSQGPDLGDLVAAAKATRTKLRLISTSMKTTISRAGDVLTVRGINLGWTDAEIVAFCRGFPDEVRQRRKTMALPTTGSLVELKLYFQHNKISNDGVAALVDALQKLTDVAWVSDLRLYSNAISKTDALAEFLNSQLKPCHELHLSDNRIEDVRLLVDAAVSAAQKFGRRRNRPLWVPIHNNCIKGNQREIFAQLGPKTHVCGVTPQCTRDHCIHDSAVHLVKLYRQQQDEEEDDVDPCLPTTTSKKTWLAPSSRPGHFELRLNRHTPALGDDEVIQIALAVRLEMMHRRITVDVRADGNRIGDRGIVALAGVLLHTDARVRVFSVCHNNVSNAGLRAVADLVHKSNWPIAELGLSHNRITDPRPLYDAIENRHQHPPLQLRISHNPFERAETRDAPPRHHQRPTTIVEEDVPPPPPPPPPRPPERKSHSEVEPVSKEAPPRPPQLLRRDARDDDESSDDSGTEVRRLEDEIRRLRGQLDAAKTQKKTKKTKTTTKEKPLDGPPPLKENDRTEANKSKDREPPKKDVRKETEKKRIDENGLEKEGKQLAKSMVKLGYDGKHADWIRKAFFRCRNDPWATTKTTWVLFSPEESFEYTFAEAVLPDGASQRKLQDRLLELGCVAVIVRSTKALKVIVLACSQDVEHLSKDDIHHRVASCLPGAPVMKKKETKKKKKNEPTDDKEEEAHEVKWEQASLSPPGSNSSKSSTTVEDEPDEIDALAAEHAVQDALTAQGVRKLKGTIGVSHLSDLATMTHDVWEYVVDAMDDKDEEYLGSALDAMIPTFQKLTDDVQAVAARTILETTIPDGPDLTDFISAARSVVKKTTNVISTTSTSIVTRWERLVSNLMTASSDEKMEAAVVVAGLLLFWRRRGSQRRSEAVEVLSKRFTGFSTAELGVAFQDRGLTGTAKWLGKTDPRSELRSRLKAVTAVKEKRRQKTREDRERKETRSFLLERFATRPSTAGWTSSIKAKTFFYGKDRPKIRYLDGKVVTTSGQKEIVIKDEPEPGQGYNRFKKSTGTLRCAAAGSKGAQ